MPRKKKLDFPLLQNISISEELSYDMSFWEKKFQKMIFYNMDLLEAHAIVIDSEYRQQQKKEFLRIRPDFLKYLAYHLDNDLRHAGFTEEDIFYCRKGIEPENFSVHLKVPFDYAGSACFQNMVLIQNRPYHELIHQFMDMQRQHLSIGEIPCVLYVPSPTGKVYISSTDYSGSGGKGKHDRSAFAGYTESAFKRIEQQTMRGR